MNCKLYSTLAFVAGALIGSVVTWKYAKEKYERITQEEVETFKEEYSKRKLEQRGKEVSEEIKENSAEYVTKPKPDLMEYASKIKDLGYSEDDDEPVQNEDVEEEGEAMFDGPYVISPDDYDENGYETESLTYYADGVLTDSYDVVIDDVDDLVGLESLEHFGEYEDDSVFVRNDDRQIDYEILKDYRNYYDVFPSKKMEE